MNTTPVYSGDRVKWDGEWWTVASVYNDGLTCTIEQDWGPTYNNIRVSSIEDVRLPGESDER